MSNIREIDWMPAGNNLAEIYQEVETKFALAFMSEKGVITQSHEWVKCRDFLQDAIAGELHDYAVEIYGFKFNSKTAPKRNRVCLDRTILMVSQKGIDNPGKFEANLLRALHYINYYEKLVGLPLSELTSLPENNVQKDYKYVWLFEGPKFWISAPHLISLFTLLVRLGEKLPEFMTTVDPADVLKELANDPKYPEHTSDNDIKYLRDCYDKIDVVLKLTSKIEDILGTTPEGFSKLYGWQTYPTGLTQGLFHDKSGILSVCKKVHCVPELNKMLTKEFK